MQNLIITINWEFFLSIIGTLIALAWYSGSKFNRIDGSLANLEGHVSNIDRNVSSLEREVRLLQINFQGLEIRVTNIERKMV